jgi:hypothetical protein
MAEATEIAATVLAVAAPELTYLTGTEVLVDGGMSAGRPMVMPPGFEPPQ